MTLRVLALSSPIYAHTANAGPFVTGLRARGVDVHRGVAEPWSAAGPSPVDEPGALWSTGPVRPYDHRRDRVRDVASRYVWLLDDARARLGPTRRLVERLRPDLVLTDSLGYAAALVSEQLSVPWVSFGDGPLHFPDEHTPPFGAGLPYRTPRPWVWRNRVVQAASRQVLMREPQARYDRLRAGLGLAPSKTPVLEASLSPSLHLHCGAPELEYPRAALPDHVHLVGALRPQGRPWTRPAWWDEVVEAHAGRVVLVSQGTLRPDPHELLAPAAEALRRAGRPGVLATGGSSPELLGGPGLLRGADDGSARHRGTAPYRGPATPPAAPVAAEAFVPYQAVLPQTSVFVTNGGWTGVLLALAYGVPVLQVGHTEEKADIGRRVAWAGAGLHAGRAEPARLVRLLDRVDTAAYRAGARAVAASLATRDPGRDGAALMLDLMRTRGAAQDRTVECTDSRQRADRDWTHQGGR